MLADSVSHWREFDLACLMSVLLNLTGRLLQVKITQIKIFSYIPSYESLGLKLGQVRSLFIGLPLVTEMNLKYADDLDLSYVTITINRVAV